MAINSWEDTGFFFKMLFAEERFAKQYNTSHRNHFLFLFNALFACELTRHDRTLRRKTQAETEKPRARRH